MQRGPEVEMVERQRSAQGMGALVPVGLGPAGLAPETSE